MSCNTDHYKYALDCIIGWFNDGILKLAGLFGSKVIAIVFAGIAMILCYSSLGTGRKSSSRSLLSGTTKRPSWTGRLNITTRIV